VFEEENGEKNGKMEIFKLKEEGRKEEEERKERVLEM